MKGIEDRIIEAHGIPEEQEKVLRELFAAYMDPRNEFFGLLNTLGSVQKQIGGDWIQHVIACMYAMELHDAGMFPADWFPPDEDDALEAYNNARMG